MVRVSELENVSWQCVHFAQPNSIDVLKHDLSTEGFYIKEFDSSSVKSDRDLFSYIANAFEFPDYFGNNWDSMDECLADIDLSHSKGAVLILSNASCLWKEAAYTAGKLLSVWQGAAELWGNENKPFHLVFVL